MEQKTISFTEFDRLYGKYGQKLHFPVCLSEYFLQTEIEELDLSVRSYNCLRRAGLRTVGDIIDRIDRRSDLLQIRNLGARSADEIMKALMKFQCSLLPAEERQNYIRRVEEMSMEACHERKDESRKSS